MNYRILMMVSLVLTLNACWKKEADRLHATVALVNDEIITVEEVMNLLPDQEQRGTEKQKTNTTEIETLKRELLNQLIERKMLLQAAIQQNLVLTKAEITHHIDLLRGEVDEETFFQRLSDQKISRGDWEKAIRENLLIEKLLTQLAHQDDGKMLSVTDEVVRAFYENNREQWHVGEQLKLRQIIVDTAEKAEIVHLSILKGADFSETARIHAQQSQIEDNGNLGYVTRNEVPIAFDSLFRADVGSVSEVIKTPFGYHIVMVEDKKPERILPFVEIKVKLHQRLLELKKEQIFSKWIEKLRLKTEVRINEKLLKTVS